MPFGGSLPRIFLPLTQFINVVQLVAASINVGRLDVAARAKQ